ncbi:unnamed protein product [Leptosia nina]|uniref:Uncharacterized protein n=1 Tax=Leptosia nina TaxID=320188 RepID=A0AAV1JRK7_9NEOP
MSPMKKVLRQTSTKTSSDAPLQFPQLTAAQIGITSSVGVFDSLLLRRPHVGSSVACWLSMSNSEVLASESDENEPSSSAIVDVYGAPIGPSGDGQLGDAMVKVIMVLYRSVFKLRNLLEAMLYSTTLKDGYDNRLRKKPIVD